MLDIKIKYVLAFVDIYVIFYIKNFDIKIKPKSDISINALVCGCVRLCVGVGQSNRGVFLIVRSYGCSCQANPTYLLSPAPLFRSSTRSRTFI